MRRAYLALLSGAALCLAAAPALAQTYPAYPAPAYGYGYNYGYTQGYTYGPPVMGPIGQIAAAPFVVAGGLAGAATAPVAAIAGAPMAVAPAPRCGVWHDFNGRYTSVCGP